MLTVHVPDSIAERMRRRAHTRGISVEDLVVETLARGLSEDDAAQTVPEALAAPEALGERRRLGRLRGTGEVIGDIVSPMGDVWEPREP